MPDNDEELRRVQEQLNGSRLVYDVGLGEFVGVAYPTDRFPGWEYVPFEREMERLFRESAIKLLVSGIGGPAPDSPSALDEAVTAAGFALSPWHFVRAVFAAANRIAANLLLPGFAAEVVAAVADAAVSEALPPGRERLVRTMNGLAILSDIAENQMTPLGEKVTLDRIAKMVESRTAGVPEPADVDNQGPRIITPSRLVDLEGRPARGALPEPGDEPDEPPPPTRRNDEEPPSPDDDTLEP